MSRVEIIKAGAALLLVVVVLGGCVERTITITSEPAGALVHLNDEAVGRTPVTVPFTFYGVYDVRLDLDGYEPMWTAQKAEAPLWEYPGPDLIGEMIPGAEVGLAWHYTLTPQLPADEVDPDALVERAEAMAVLLNEEADEASTPDSSAESAQDD